MVKDVDETSDEVVKKKNFDLDVEKTCDVEVKKKCEEKWSQEAGKETTQIYKSKKQEKKDIQDEEALREALAEEDRAEREMEERIREDREFEDMV